MAYPESGVCRFYGTTNGCRYGNKCRYSHDLSHSTTLRGSSSHSGQSSPGGWRGRQEATASHSSRPSNRGRGGFKLGGIPHNTCQFYWTSGSCNRGFDCSFRHVKGPETADAEEDATAAQSDEDEHEGAVDFFSPSGLAAGAGAVHDDRLNMTPSEVHNHLKEFLTDDYRFESAAHVQGFVRLLASVSDNNKAWNSENAQEFLGVVVKGNSLVRITDILVYEPVDVAVGSHTGVLSFQRGYFPVFQFLASDLVLKSTLHKNINLLYAVIKNNHSAVFTTWQKCLRKMMADASWKDPTPRLAAFYQNNLSGITVFRTLSTVLLQYFNRYKDAVRNNNNANVPAFTKQLADWFDTWAADVSAFPPRFEDDPISSMPSNNRQLIISHIREDIDRLISIVEREAGLVQQRTASSTITNAQRSQARTAQLAQTYDPPGSLREDGPRHDNDFMEIDCIRIAPTHDELLCAISPYLPVFSRDAPHHWPADSMQRHLDIQFRLLREELFSTTRTSLAVVHDDLLKMWSGSRKKSDKTILEDLMDKNGGVYRTSGRDSVFFQLYTNAEFAPLYPPEASRKGVCVTLAVDTPPGGAARDKDTRKRVEYWEHAKRLQGASLVALVIVADRTLRVHLGVIASYGKDVAESAKHDQGRVQVRISFFDAEVELMAMRGERLCTGKSNFAVLVDNGVMFESVRPFLHKLQTIEPTEIPFARHIAPGGPLDRVQVAPPKYALVPGFRFDLQCLAKPGESITPLDALNPLAVRRAREQLVRSSILDPSQAEAVVDTLTREVSLIQGPPGTGKSFTAKEILRVLFANKIRPIVLIAYTNHALDHMLTSVLDAGITEKVVRLGTRSSEERIAQYTLGELEKRTEGSTFDRSMKQQYAMMKQCEERLTTTMASIRLPLASWEKIEELLGVFYGDHYDSIQNPPSWIAELARLKWEEEDLEGEFEEVRRKGKKKQWSVRKPGHRTMYGIWREGVDIHFLQQTSPASSKPRRGNHGGYGSPRIGFLLANPHRFFASLGPEAGIPLVPRTNRPLDTLLQSSNVWNMSLVERARLADEWEADIRAQAYESQLAQYRYAKQDFGEECQKLDEMRDEARRRLLSQTDLIACTTTGAASLTSLLSSIAPKVLMVEEAGQVLEAHILTSLVSSVRHLICIGDPKQLRPTMATFTLSMDSGIGKDLYKFDRSLMERLSDAGYPMSQINVQRRMRPTISHFIRTILYPKLQDHQVVAQYPPVQGMQTNVFFFNHLNKENGTEDSVSKFNMFEVDMIRDLVVYFLRQGTYSGPGDIAVLCAYLGQLQKVRAALRDLKIAVAVDERDAEQLARQGLDEEPEVEMEEVLVAKHVRLGTVDIFQGQEAKIVIVSLVRNSGHPETGAASIGFLKSPNRINVALSRAKHGLYIFGNAANLRQNPTWSMILDDMESRGQIGSTLPIICPRHPEQVQTVSKPGELPLYAPAGGCVLPCGTQLACGHICPSTCHAVLDNHRSTKCTEPCPRTPCPRQHPCSKRCSDDCGKCMFPIYSVALPCDHVAPKVFCYQLEDLASVKCSEQVRKELLGCEHSAVMACHRDPSTVSCMERCEGTLPCCSKMCKASCSGCRSLTLQRTQSSASGRVSRTHHGGHPCGLLLPCQHACGLDCVKGHACNTKCLQPCRQRCAHQECSEPCSEPCAPCTKPCEWSCAHFTCPLPCGSICPRLPCDEPCAKSLQCGHPCPSVCGEPCAAQKCQVCSSAKKTDLADLAKQLLRLDDGRSGSRDLSERHITLPCGHTFTVQTLDRHCGMREYYDVDPMGHFTAPKSPPASSQMIPPTCPTCRGPITALRYGRITKRAALDILEQNFARAMSAVVDVLSPSVSSHAANLSTYQGEARGIEASIITAKTLSRQSVSFAQSGPLPETALDLGGMQRVHGLALEEARTWHQIVRDIVSTYRRVVKLANARGPHVKTYEAALSALLRIEAQDSPSDSENRVRAAGLSDDEPDPTARAANAVVESKLGQPRPQADVPFQVEAYFLSLELRSLLAQIAQARVERLSQTSVDPDIARHRALWTSFVSFLYASCVADAEKAAALALALAAKTCPTPPQPLRLAARARVLKLQFAFDVFKWRTACERAAFLRAGALDADARARLGRNATDHKRDLAQSFKDVVQGHLRALLPRTAERLKEEREWLIENCCAKADALERECTMLEETFAFVERAGVERRVSVRERETAAVSVKRESSSDKSSGCIVS